MEAAAQRGAKRSKLALGELSSERNAPHTDVVLVSQLIILGHELVDDAAPCATKS